MKKNIIQLSKIGIFDQSIALNLAQCLSYQLGQRKLKYKSLYMGAPISISFFALLIYYRLLLNPFKLSSSLLITSYLFAIVAIGIITYPVYCFDNSNIFRMKLKVYRQIKNIPFEKSEKYFDLVLYSFDRITKKDNQYIKLIYTFIGAALTVLTKKFLQNNIFSNLIERNINVTLGIVYIVICIGCWIFYTSKINKLVDSRVRLFLYSVLEHKILNENI